jgi:hypothetical protein
MSYNWTTGSYDRRVEPLKLPKPRQVAIRAIAGRKSGFWHQGRTVAVGEIIECDFDLAEMLIKTGKAERV